MPPSTPFSPTLLDGFNHYQGGRIFQSYLGLVGDPTCEAVGTISFGRLRVERDDIDHIVEDDLLHLPNDILAGLEVRCSRLLVVQVIKLRV